MNQVFLTGRLTKDPTLLYAKETQKPWCSFALAVETMTKSGDRSAEFFECKAFGQTAENICKYLTKGRKMIVSGKLYREKKQMKDGTNLYETKIFVTTFEFADKAADYGNVKENQEMREARQAKLDEFMQIPSDADMGLPFK